MQLNGSAVLQCYARLPLRRWRYAMDILVNEQQIFTDVFWKKEQFFGDIGIYNHHNNDDQSVVHIIGMCAYISHRSNLRPGSGGAAVKVQANKHGFLSVAVHLPESYKPLRVRICL